MIENKHAGLLMKKQKTMVKKTLLLTLAGLLSSFGFTQTTAPNFIGNDCSGNSHNFFNEMDAGKVLVLSWVMPCPACELPSQTAYNIVQSYQSSYPNRVFYYLLDDFADNPCSALDTFATKLSMTNVSAKFSDTAIHMFDYSNGNCPGMPTIAVLGGTSHTIFYYVGDSINSITFQNAVTTALNAAGISDPINEFASLQVFPNPADNSTAVSYSLSNASDVTIEIYNVRGQKAKSVFSGKQNAGECKFDIDCNGLSNGIYFVKLVAAGKVEKTVMLSVLH